MNFSLKYKDFRKIMLLRCILTWLGMSWISIGYIIKTNFEYGLVTGNKTMFIMPNTLSFLVMILSDTLLNLPIDLYILCKFL